MSETTAGAFNKSYEPFEPDNPNEKDVEKRGSRRASTGRRMSRIGPPPAGPTMVVTSDSDSDDKVGQQIALEAENAIKYRTCSWQKVLQSFAMAS